METSLPVGVLLGEEVQLPNEQANEEVEVMRSMHVEARNWPCEVETDHGGSHDDTMHDMCQNGTLSFSAGESFQTFEELEDKIKEYEQARSVQLWRRDSRTIDAARR